MLHRYRAFHAAPALALIWFTAAAGFAADFRIVVNNKALDTTTQGPVVVRGSLLVPLAAIGNALGAYLEWRPDTRTVYGRRNMNEFLLPVNSSTATVNGKTQALDTPASIIGGRTMVPLRFVATALGADVSFEGSTKTVNISTSGGGGATNPPPTTTGSSVYIDRFYITPNRALRGGDTYTVTLEGTPGAKAEYD